MKCQTQMLGHTNYSAARVLVAVAGADHRVGLAQCGQCGATPVLVDSKDDSSCPTISLWMSSPSSCGFQMCGPSSCLTRPGPSLCFVNGPNKNYAETNRIERNRSAVIIQNIFQLDMSIRRSVALDSTRLNPFVHPVPRTRKPPSPRSSL